MCNCWKSSRSCTLSPSSPGGPGDPAGPGNPTCPCSPSRPAGPNEPFSPWRGTEVIGHYSWSYSCTVVNLLISQSKISCRHSPARPSLPLAQGGQHLLYGLADQWHLQAQRVLFLLWHPVQTKKCNILVRWSILRKTHGRRKVRKKHLQLVLQHQGGPPHPSDLQYPNKP